MSAHQRGNQSGRLIGWLVSYVLDQKGKSFEIRAGRTFISGKEIPGERQINLDLKDLATAHVVLNASPRHKVVVQDCFSPTGSYLVRNGREQAEQISGPMEISHGDWIRLGGQFRFQVCLIDGPGR